MHHVHKFVENCSTQFLENTVFHYYNNPFLPSNLMSVLQTAACTWVCRFSAHCTVLLLCAFWTSGKEYLSSLRTRSVIKTNEVITTYVAVKYMSEAWDVASSPWDPETWRKTGLLHSQQAREAKDLRIKHLRNVKATTCPQRGTATRTKEAL